MKLSILASAFMATLASAVDIYLYPNPQCMGTALVCRNIEPGACCGSSVAVYASAKYSNPSTSSRYVWGVSPLWPGIYVADVYTIVAY